VLVLGEDAALLEINPSGLALLGCDSAEVVLGRPFEQFIAREHRDGFRNFHNGICAGRRGSFECDLIGLQEQKVNVQILSAPLTNRDDGNQHLAIARNVTDIRQMAEQVRRSQHLDAIGKLTGGIAHDFNNLLTVILGGTDELYASLKNDPSLKNDIVTVRSAAERAAVLTQRLLAFSRQQALEPKPTHVGKLLRGLEPLLRRTLGEDIELVVTVDETAGCIARVDPHQLENAVLNLCINSRDAMPAGGYLTLEVDSITMTADDVAVMDDFAAGDYVLLTVTDTGEGMKEDVVSRAFEPFFTTKETGKGTGLGLSMVYGFVKQSSGQARIYTEHGHGTSVKLYFPAFHDGTTAEAGMPDHDITIVETGRPDSRNRNGVCDHILVVEDNESVLKLATRHLNSLGYRTTTARNGLEAVELMKQNSFDLLFTDIMMPGGMNGRQLADAAISLRPGLPVLFTSGYTETAINREGALPPGTSLLSKPYRRADLERKLRQLLDGRPVVRPSGG
jgi:signal transduction histidine kinase/ActR/RegA family two-component response regulator